ncbi:MAG: hypothetical protein RBR25_16500, partial [Trichloromonas sp.]|nr:hypothetical protein [Trichloromonas sp.]
LPSDPAVTSNALAIRIVFPLAGVTPVSCNRPGLPATLGKQKTATHYSRVAAGCRPAAKMSGKKLF